MQVELAPNEVEVLTRLLRAYLADLSYEIADTSTPRFRDELREHRSVVRGIMDRLSVNSETAVG